MTGPRDAKSRERRRAAKRARRKARKDEAKPDIQARQALRELGYVKLDGRGRVVAFDPDHRL